MIILRIAFMNDMQGLYFRSFIRYAYKIKISVKIQRFIDITKNVSYHCAVNI